MVIITLPLITMIKFLVPLLFLSFIYLQPTSGIAQEVAQQPATKLDKFISKSGVIIKFEDYSLPRMSQQFGLFAESRVRKVYAGDDVKLFYQITNESKYGTKVASVAQEDFEGLQKAFLTLKSQLASDLKSPADYLENKYVTADGVQLGYLINKGKETWYMQLEKYGSSSIFLKSAESIEGSFSQASIRFAELK